MLIVKIMSAEDTHDTDPRKSFALHAGVIEAHFERRGDGTSANPRDHKQPWLTLRFSRKTDDREVDDAISFEPSGNVYVMNEGGKTIASYGVSPIIYAQADAVDEADQIKKAAERFLSWSIPKSFNPDGGISFDPSGVHPNHWPTGTNLFDYTQAEAMIRHVLMVDAPARGA